MIMVIGTRKGEHEPTLEGTPPLFDGYLDLTWLPQDMAHSWHAQMRRGKGGWQPMLLLRNPRRARSPRQAGSSARLTNSCGSA